MPHSRPPFHTAEALDALGWDKTALSSKARGCSQQAETACGGLVVWRSCLSRPFAGTSAMQDDMMGFDLSSIEEMDPSLADGFHIIYSREVGQSVFFPLFVPCNVSFTSFLLQSCLI